MARPKYILQKSDGLTAWAWINGKIRSYSLGFSANTARSVEAKQALEATKSGRHHKKLNTWAETYLTTEEWVQLKNTLRARRKRAKDRPTRAIVTANLTRSAHVILRELSKHYQVTQSEIIVRFLDKEFTKISGG